MYRKFYYNSPLIGFKSFNINTPRYYSTCGNNKPKIEDENLQIHPRFITGFVDGEGCFSCSVLKSRSYKLGWEIQPIFQIKLHIKDYLILLRIKESLGVIGTLTTNQSVCVYRVRKLNELIELVKFFDIYPLISRKKGIIYCLKKLYLLFKWKNTWRYKDYRRL